jgi:two-component sensor histidine kinase
MQADALNDKVVRKALSDAAMRISTIALIHAHLCEAPRGASVDMRAFVEELVANISRTLTDPRSGVQTRLDVAPLTLPLHLATHCGLLISEIVTNAFQHAFCTRNRGAINITLTVARGEGTLTVKDDGVGLPHDPRADAGTTGIGLSLVRLLATRQLRGRVSISSRKGTTVTVKFPLEGRRDD